MNGVFYAPIPRFIFHLTNSFQLLAAGTIQFLITDYQNNHKLTSLYQRENLVRVEWHLIKSLLGEDSAANMMQNIA